MLFLCKAVERIGKAMIDSQRYRRANKCERNFTKNK